MNIKNDFLHTYKRLSSRLSRYCDNPTKTLEQILFLYFTQSATYLRDTFNQCIKNKQNYYHDYLAPLLNITPTQDNLPNEVFSNANATGILDIFDQYKFSARENTSLNAITPEILGDVYESALPTHTKKSHGTVYTPRQIVHFMCQESLIYFLHTTTHITYDTLANFIHHNTKSDEIISHANIIDSALGNVRVFDAAIGCGAFPVAMLNEITTARINLLPQSHDAKIAYEYKRHAIENSIYGSDINNDAINITKMRLWLSLLSDADPTATATTPEYNLWHINPLLDTVPTTDFDIVIGNPPYVGEKSNKEQFQQIKKHSLGKFYHAKMDLFYFFFHLALNLIRPSGIISFITTNYFVTANSAYNLRSDIKQRSTILKLINFNELKLFDNATGQHNLISILQPICATSPAPKCQCITTKRSGTATPEIIHNILSGTDDATTYITVPQDKLYDGTQNYIRIAQTAPTITSKMRANSDRLGDMFNINQGIISGADKASPQHLQHHKIPANCDDGIYVLDTTNPHDAAILTQIKSKGEHDILRPFYKNSDIKRFWSASDCTKHIIYANKSKSDLSKYPTTQSHLKRFKPILDKSSANSPYLHRPRNEAIFLGKKIIAPQRSSLNTFAYNNIPWFSSADVYYITPSEQTKYDIKYVLGLLNSKLYYFWLYNYGKRKGETLELYQTPLSDIPIKLGTPTQVNAIIALVNKILSSTTPAQSDTDALNDLVYAVYDLTDAEQEYINKTCK